MVVAQALPGSHQERFTLHLGIAITIAAGRAESLVSTDARMRGPHERATASGVAKQRPQPRARSADSWIERVLGTWSCLRQARGEKNEGVGEHVRIKFHSCGDPPVKPRIDDPHRVKKNRFSCRTVLRPDSVRRTYRSDRLI
jgi:hypothetical protein